MTTNILIEVFGPVSGAHFNPAVSAVMAWRGDLPKAALLPYVAAQLIGAMLGAWLAHAMFGMTIFQLSTHVRTGTGQWIAEAVATAGLLLVILRAPPGRAAAMVAAYIGAAYWFTASTSFANPAAAFGRMFSHSFAGIEPASVVAFVVAQCVGASIGLGLHHALGLPRNGRTIGSSGIAEHVASSAGADDNGSVEPVIDSKAGRTASRHRLPSMNIRAAIPADADAITAIYAPIVTGTSISFELAPPSVDEMRGRIVSTLRQLPWLVSEDAEGRVDGYVYASKHRERPAYQWSVDVTAYVREDVRGSGIGKRLYAALFSELAALGYFQAFAGIALPNAASVALHEAVGFEPIGIYRKVGFKLGAWHDVGWWQRELRKPLEAFGPSAPLVFGAGARQPVERP